MSCNFLDEHDATGLLREGTNELAVEVYCDNVPTCHAAPAEPALFLVSGAVVTDESWQVQHADEYRSDDVGLYTFQIGLMEWRDLRRTPRGWQRFEDGASWTAAMVIPRDRPIYSKDLFLRDLRFLRHRVVYPATVTAAAVSQPGDRDCVDVAKQMTRAEYELLHLDGSGLCRGEPLCIDPLCNGKDVSLVLGFEDEFIGHLQLELDAPGGTIVDVGYQEEMSGLSLRLAVDDYRFADRYITAEGRQNLGGNLRWRGGRFVQLVLRRFDRPVRIHCAAILDHRYPMDHPAEFSCDDPGYNALWLTCVSTLSACATDALTDCPWREMAFWVNDFVVTNRFWLQLSGKADLSRRCLALALSQRDACGLIPGVCPYNGQSRLVLYPTNLFLPIILDDYVMHTGDVPFIRAVLDDLVDLVTRCEQHTDERGLLCPPANVWNFVDWSYELTNRPLDGRCACAVNWFHVLALRSLAKLLQMVGDRRANYFADRVQQVAALVDRHFWDRSAKCYREWLTEDGDAESPLAGKLAHALAWLSGQLVPARQAAVGRAMQRNDLMWPELYMMHFVFEAMVDMGRLDDVHALIARYWGPMVACGSPTIWEANVHEHGKEAFENRGSLCHAFSLAPVNVLQRHVLGVAPLDPGYARFAVKPSLGHLQHARGTIHTPAGIIILSCHKSPSGLRLDLTVPGEAVAILPDERVLGAGRHEVTVAY